jgi:hypothetical protein
MQKIRVWVWLVWVAQRRGPGPVGRAGGGWSRRSPGRRRRAGAGARAQGAWREDAAHPRAVSRPHEWRLVWLLLRFFPERIPRVGSCTSILA